MQQHAGPAGTSAAGGIRVVVRSFAALREVADPEVRLDLPAGATVRSVLMVLTARFRGLEQLLFTPAGELRDFVNILRNGRNVQFLAGLDTPLADGDTVALFPPAAGG